jgi:hypothetical protein
VLIFFHRNGGITMNEENTPEKEGNRRFDYEIGMWRDADGKEINQIDSKQRISTADLAEAYLSLINKNAIQVKSNFYAEDLIKETFPFLSIRRLKGNVTKVIRLLGEHGVKIEKPLEYKSDIIKKEKKVKKSGKKTILDVIAKSGDLKGIRISKSAISFASRHTTSREEKLNNRYRRNTEIYKEQQEAGEARLARNQAPSVIIKLDPVPADITEFKKRFAGNFTDIGRQEPWGVNEYAYEYFVKKRGRSTNLQNEAEFWVWVAKVHKEFHS